MHLNTIAGKLAIWAIPNACSNGTPNTARPGAPWLLAYAEAMLEEGWARSEPLPALLPPPIGHPI
jgi:hypothetical protein